MAVEHPRDVNFSDPVDAATLDRFVAVSHAQLQIAQAVLNDPAPLIGRSRALDRALTEYVDLLGIVDEPALVQLRALAQGWTDPENDLENPEKDGNK